MVTSASTYLVAVVVVFLSVLIGNIDFGPGRWVFSDPSSWLAPINPLPSGLASANAVTIMYCASCQTNGAAQQVARFLAAQIASHPTANFLPYAAAPFYQMCHALLTVAQWLAIAFFAFGPSALFQSWRFESQRAAETARRARDPDRPPPRLPQRVEDVPVPNWVTDLQDKRWMLLGVIFFFGNMVKQILVKTNAFEVFYNNHLLHSMVQTGAFPTLDQLRRTLQDLNVPLRH